MLRRNLTALSLLTLSLLFIPVSFPAPAVAASNRPRYDLRPGPEGTWSGVNEAHQLRLVISGEGVRMVPLTPGPAPWDWSLSLLAYGPPGEPHAAQDRQLFAADDRIELAQGRLTELFVNGPKGVQHGLVLAPLDGPRLAHVDFVVGGSLTPKVSEDGRAVAFLDVGGRPVLFYRETRAMDAEGRDVTVRWQRLERPAPSSGLLRLVVEGGGHFDPVSVMGLLVTAKGEAAGADAPVTNIPETVPFAAPSNDLCAGAEVIPGAGPFPYLSSVHDITDATTIDDPPLPSCQTNLSRSVWFTFVPTSSGSYTLSLCADGPTASTVEDTVLAVYTAAGDCTGFAEVLGGCDDDTCAAGDLQSVIGTLDLSAGTTYYMVAWKYGATAPASGASAVQLRVSQDAPPGPAPANDLCGGAEIVPGAGPFPYLTALTADISGATDSGDPPAPSCQPNVSRSVWYSFTPASGGSYTFSSCADAPTGTTVDDTVMALYTGTGACSGFTQVAGGCDDDSCASEGGQSVIRGVTLSAGTTYHVVVWEYGLGRPSAGNTGIQMRVSRETAPANDVCGSAQGLLLDSPVSGSTVNAGNDYGLGAGTTCFTGIGQNSSVASGGDVAYGFVAPKDGLYSFRVTGYESVKNSVLYVATDCPAGPPPATIAACLGAANRNSGYPGEEVMCLAMAAGQSVFVYVDENVPTSGSTFTLEVNECRRETEANDSPASAGLPACGIEGAVSPAGNADFFSLGIPDAGSRLFAMVDGVAGNSTDYDLRVTTTADTLEFDDLNNDTPFGSVAPNICGAPLDGTAAYLRVSHYSAAAEAEPYRLYATVQPETSRATLEVEPNNTVMNATAGSNLYYFGALSDSNDVDVFSFMASGGELLLIGLDLDPGRNNTPFNGSLTLLDASGSSLLMVSDNGSTSSTTPGTASLSAVTPQSPGEAIAYRARSTGTYYAKVAWSGGTPGDYLVSIARDCKISPPTDLAVDLADTPDPVAPGASLAYAATVRNLGASPASVVTLSMELPPGSVFLSAIPGQGTCSGAGPVVCHLGSIPAGGQARVDVVVMAPGTAGTVTAAERVDTVVIDTDPSNDLFVQGTTVGAPADTDGDGFPDSSDCAPADANAWAVPAEAGDLRLSGAGGESLQWSAPANPGGRAVYYDLLRATAATDFSIPDCVAANATTTEATDPAVPSSAFYYLVRAKNVCGGTLGTRSDGTPRVAGACP